MIQEIARNIISHKRNTIGALLLTAATVGCSQLDGPRPTGQESTPSKPLTSVGANAETRPVASPVPTPTAIDVNAIAKAAVEAARAQNASTPVKAVETPNAGKPQVQPNTEAGRQVVRAMVDVELGHGEKVVAEHPGFVTGDVIVSNHKKGGELTRMFDDNAETGLIVEFPAGTTVIAPYGADVHMIPGNDQKLREQLIGQAVVDMKKNGCVGGCRFVYIAETGGPTQAEAAANGVRDGKGK